MFNVVIIGGESIGDYKLFESKCITLLREKAKSGCGITIYTIGDEFVDKFSAKFNIDTKIFYCNWQIYGKEAVKVRNSEILKDANGLIYFDTGKKDTEYLYNFAKLKNINCRKITIKEN